MKIYAPVKDFNGVHATVRFVNGVGETDNPRLIEWFRTHGYEVPIEDTPSVDPLEVALEQCEEPVEEEVEMMGYAEKTPNFEDMNPNELREWAKANGFGRQIKNIRTKEKLIEILRG
jgi:hypothetical protein